MAVCQCGCGQDIPWAKSHAPWYMPRFILGHQSRGKVRRITPPPDWPVPSGLCECGCGQETPIARQTRTQWGQYAGYPIRFIHGHHMRGRRLEAANSWNGGRKQNKRGYWFVFLPGHHLANKSGYVPEHRLVYEAVTGTVLKRSDHVHHIDGDPSNNNPRNLQLVTGREHAALHRNAANGQLQKATAT